MNEEIKTALSEIWGSILAARGQADQFVNHELLAPLKAAIAIVGNWPKEHHQSGRAMFFCNEARTAAKNIEWGHKVTNFEIIDADYKVLMSSIG